MYSGQLETIRRLLEADRSGTVHFAGSCLAEGVSKSGRTARLPIPKAATPAPLRKVRLLVPPPKFPDALPTTTVLPCPDITMPPTLVPGQGIRLSRPTNATEPLQQGP